jgi:hypothetical protein
MRTALSIAVALVLAPSCSTGRHDRCVDSFEMESTYVVQVRVGADATWASLKSALSHFSPSSSYCQDAVRQVLAQIEGSRVKLSVEEVDPDHSVIRISAKGSLEDDAAIATMVKDRILSDLEQKH